MKKQIISSIASIVIAMNTIGLNLTANAKVIEPEIVKTETWTTSYYIDDNIETLYPYIDCQADIYNDGTMKVYFWNTHEWDGFATVSQTVTIIGSKPVSVNNAEYLFKQHDIYLINGRAPSYPISYDNYLNNGPYTEDYSFWDNVDVSYYAGYYNYNENLRSFYMDRYNSNKRYNFYYYGENFGKCDGYLSHFVYKGSLAELSVNEKSTLSFKPTVIPNDTYSFRILGHNITITPDILSSSIVAQPQLTDQEKYIKELEEKIQKLENGSSNGQTSNLFGDIDGNDIIDGRDATVLLTYYAKTSTGYKGTLEEFIANYASETKKNERPYEAVFVGGDTIPYKAFTPTDQIVKGEKTALKTISRKIGKEVSLSNTIDTVKGSSLISVVFKNNDTNEQLDYYSVKDFAKSERVILFLFNDDTDAVIAEKTDISFVDADYDKIYSDWRDEKYHNENNYNSQGIFSWYADGASHAIFSENAGSITSVWAYDSTTNKADVIWKDNVNCHIWIDYSILDQYVKE